MKRSTIFFVALAAFLIFGAGSAQARGGALDPSFGTGGRVFDSSFEPAALTLQPDGKIVVVGSCCGSKENPSDFFIGRYDGDGSRDSNYGGALLESLGGSAGTALTPEPGGIMLAAGVTGYDGFLVRIASDGSLDPSFGTDGVAMLTNIEPTAIELEPGGKIIVVGTQNARIPFSGDLDPPEIALARFDPNGSLDPTFGTNGIVATSFGGSDFVKAAAEQPDGKIVVGGYRGFLGAQGPYYDGILVRYKPDGSLDSTFQSVGGSDVVDAVYLQADGKVLTGEFAGEGSLRRYNADGSIDDTFKPAFGAPSGLIGLEPDGKIVTAGGSQVARFLPDGTPDVDFGRLSVGTKAGLVTIPDFGAEAVGVQTDGRIVVAGGDGHRNLVLVRLLPDRSQTLRVKRSGRARGTVVSSPAGISCTKPHGKERPRKHGTCTQLFEQGSTVTLTVSNAPRSRVTWGGACSGHARSCTVTMDGGRSVRADFRRR